MQQIKTDGSVPFARFTMAERIPAILNEVVSRNDFFSLETDEEILRLKENILMDGKLPEPPLPSPDYEIWQHSLHTAGNESWLNSQWFFAENYVYRLLMDAVRWWETGRDPFLEKKDEEYGKRALRDLLDQAEDAAWSGRPEEERLSELLAFSLWGNRIDLSHDEAARQGSGADESSIILDQREKVLPLLLGQKGSGTGQLDFVLDNAGAELLMDLVLLDFLLQLTDFRIILHVKAHPAFVSDATAADVLSGIGKFGLYAYESPGNSSVARTAERLKACFQARRIIIAPDSFWNSPCFLDQMPVRLERTFRRSTLIVFKGDANYRRLSGDLLYPPETPLSEFPPIPAPLLVVRTMKSDSIAGLPPGLADRLSAEDPQWRTNGKRGIIQFRDVSIIT